MKRLFDIIFSIVAIIIFSPIFLFLFLLLFFTSREGVFYIQRRVGKNNKDFSLLKFRTMKPDAEKSGLLTVGSKDPRVTKLGYYLRKYKLDELPQLFNVLMGDMSMVGPRPEVRKYVELYNEEQKKILNVRPGITDYASIAFINENELLTKSENPEKTYIEEIMPAKLELNSKYISERNLFVDIKIIFTTVLKIFS